MSNIATETPRRGFTLYEIPREIQSLWDRAEFDEDTGEVLVDLAALDTLEMALETKALGCAKKFKSLKAEAEAVESERKRLQARESSLKNQAERLRAYMAANIPEGETFADPTTKITWRKNPPCVVVEDEEAIPPEFVEMVPNIRKTPIKEALQAGREVPGAHLEQTTALSIK